MREAVAELIEGNVHRMQEWLDRVAESDPAKALDFVVKLLEYNIPKLARSDVSVSEAPQRELSPTELAVRVAAVLNRGGIKVAHADVSRSESGLTDTVHSD